MVALSERSRARSLSVTDTTDGVEVATLADDDSPPPLTPLLSTLSLTLPLETTVTTLADEDDSIRAKSPPDGLNPVVAPTDTTGMISTEGDEEEDEDVLAADNPTDSLDTGAVTTESPPPSGFDLTEAVGTPPPPLVSSSDSTVQFDLRFRSRLLLTLDGLLRITLPVNNNNSTNKKRKKETRISHPIRLFVSQ